MINVPALFAPVRWISSYYVLWSCAARADTVIQVNLNGSTTGIFGDQIGSYQIELYDAETPHHSRQLSQLCQYERVQRHDLPPRRAGLYHSGRRI